MNELVRVIPRFEFINDRIRLEVGGTDDVIERRCTASHGDVLGVVASGSSADQMGRS